PPEVLTNEYRRFAGEIAVVNVTVGRTATGTPVELLVGVTDLTGGAAANAGAPTSPAASAPATAAASSFILLRTRARLSSIPVGDSGPPPESPALVGVVLRGDLRGHAEDVRRHGRVGAAGLAPDEDPLRVGLVALVVVRARLADRATADREPAADH